MEDGVFTWPAVNGKGSIELSGTQFAVLTQGLDWRRVKIPETMTPMLA